MVKPELTIEMAQAVSEAIGFAAERKHRALRQMVGQAQVEQFREAARDEGVLRVAKRILDEAILDETLFPKNAPEAELRALAGDR